MARCLGWLAAAGHGVAFGGGLLYEAAQAIGYGVFLTLFMITLAVVCLQEWLRVAICVCSVVVGWNAHGWASSEAVSSEMDMSGNNWRSDMGAYLDPQTEQTWTLAVSEVTFVCKEKKKILKARVRAGKLDVHFSDVKIVSGSLEEAGLLRWGDVLDKDGKYRCKSSALPWRRVVG